MASPVKTANVKALFASFDRLAPNRDRASDGWIGDLAHQQGTSGHNPDDYPGVKAERQDPAGDPDNIPEVRAADVDKDLRHPTVSMEDVVQLIVRTPALRDRLIYVIYNRRIWEASNGWRERPYTGSNPHDKHAHFSGHPNHDDNGTPWRQIEELGGDTMSDRAEDTLERLREEVLSPAKGFATDPGGEVVGTITQQRNAAYAIVRGNEQTTWLGREVARMRGLITTMQATLTTLSGKDFTDEPQIIAGVLAGLKDPALFAQAFALAGWTPADFANALPEEMAAEVVDLIGERLAGGGSATLNGQ